MFERPKVVMTIRLTFSLPGKAILKAVENCVTENRGAQYHSEIFFIDDDTVFRVGQKSGYPYKDFIILVCKDGIIFEDVVNPNGVYSHIRLVSHSFPGMKYAIGFGDESFKAAAVDFRKRLMEKLNEVQK